MGVGSLVTMFIVGILILGFFEHLDTPRKPPRVIKKLEIAGWIVIQTWDADLYAKTYPLKAPHPDDPDSAFALMRAWDRHLIRWGLLPLNEGDPLTIRVSEGVTEYLEYGRDERGHITVYRKALRASRLRKAPPAET